MRNFTRTTLSLALMAGLASSAYAASHSSLAVMGSDQDESGGTVTAEKVVTGANGWLVVHRIGDAMKPGPVIGYSPLKAGDNENVTAILQESVNSGEKLIWMLHGKEGGMKTGVFEYTLGAKEDGPVRVDDKLMMVVIAAR